MGPHPGTARDTASIRDARECGESAHPGPRQTGDGLTVKGVREDQLRRHAPLAARLRALRAESSRAAVNGWGRPS